MRGNWTAFLSAVGIPLLGLSGLFVSLWHTNSSAAPAAAGQELTLLQSPNPHLDKSMAICLRQQAKAVAHYRAGSRQDDFEQAVADYNLIARECSPAVFTTTHLPLSLHT